MLLPFGPNCSAALMGARLIALALTALGGCVSASRDITPALQGTWGGQHVGLYVGTLDTGVEFDCAEGTIFGPYLVEEDGSFAWPGDFIRGTGGPVHADGQEEQPPIQATYAGVVLGPAMTMTVELEDHTVIGPFSLERFREPQLTRCL